MQISIFGTARTYCFVTVMMIFVDIFISRISLAGKCFFSRDGDVCQKLKITSTMLRVQPPPLTHTKKRHAHTYI